MSGRAPAHRSECWVQTSRPSPLSYSRGPRLAGSLRLACAELPHLSTPEAPPHSKISTPVPPARCQRISTHPRTARATHLHSVPYPRSVAMLPHLYLHLSTVTHLYSALNPPPILPMRLWHIPLNLRDTKAPLINIIASLIPVAR